jgi:hypothetical protein
MNGIHHIINTHLKDDEKKLALKISIASFFILLIILTSILSTSYFFSYQKIKKELREETQNIINIPEARNLLLNNKPFIEERRNDNKRKWPRDIIIINDATDTVIKNDFIDINQKIFNTLKGIKKYTISKVEIDNKAYIISKNTIDGNSIFFFRDLTPLQNFHITLLGIALLWSIFGILIIYFLSRYLARITIEPIREQSRELEAYSHNVAHELKTPLSVMRSNLELLKIKPDNKYIISTDEEITGMEHIIDSLLFLAKPDGKNNLEDINLTKKTEEIVEKYKNEATIIFISKSKSIIQSTNTDLYDRIVCNLIENAIKYKSGWEVHISLNHDNISITNDIEKNLSDIEQRNILNAFYQWDSSRNTMGYGLGLALVSKITDILWWKLQIETKNKKFIAKIYFK